MSTTKTQAYNEDLIDPTDLPHTRVTCRDGSYFRCPVGDAPAIRQARKLGGLMDLTDIYGGEHQIDADDVDVVSTWTADAIFRLEQDMKAREAYEKAQAAKDKRGEQKGGD